MLVYFANATKFGLSVSCSSTNNNGQRRSAAVFSNKMLGCSIYFRASPSVALVLDILNCAAGGLKGLAGRFCLRNEMRPTRLDVTQIDAALQHLPDWRHIKSEETGRNTLSRDYAFGDFNAAFGFMVRVAMAAERLDHHPDWSNSYNRVTISLSTHDAGGVTELDFQLARFCEAASLGTASPVARASPKV